MTTKQIENIIFQKARKYDLGYEFFREVIWEESHFDVNAVNPDSGAMGLGQLMPIVIEDFEEQTGITYTDYKKPETNLEVSAWYLGERIPKMLKHYGHEVTRKNILWAYNAGIGNLNNGILPKETQRYFEKILPDVQPRYGIQPDLTIEVQPASDMELIQAKIEQGIVEGPVSVKWKVDDKTAVGELLSDIANWYRDTPEVQTVLSIGEEIITQFIPFGSYIDATTDILNQSIINQKVMANSKPKYLSKTVWAAIIVAVTAILQALGVDFGANPEIVGTVFTIIYALAGAFGLYGLRDAVGSRKELK